MKIELAQDIPHRVDLDGSLCRAGAGIKDGAWGVYFLVDRKREWVRTNLTSTQAIRLSQQLNARDRFA